MCFAQEVIECQATPGTRILLVGENAAKQHLAALLGDMALNRSCLVAVVLAVEQKGERKEAATRRLS